MQISLYFFLWFQLPHKVDNIQLSCARPSRNLNHAFHGASSLALSGPYLLLSMDTLIKPQFAVVVGIRHTFCFFSCATDKR